MNACTFVFQGHTTELQPGDYVKYDDEAHTLAFIRGGERIYVRKRCGDDDKMLVGEIGGGDPVKIVQKVTGFIPSPFDDNRGIYMLVAELYS